MTRILAAVLLIYFSLPVWWVLWRVFGDNPPEISAGTATAFGTFLTAGVAGAFALYRWSRDRERDNGDG